MLLKQHFFVGAFVSPFDPRGGWRLFPSEFMKSILTFQKEPSKKQRRLKRKFELSSGKRSLSSVMFQQHAFDAIEMGSLKVFQHCFSVKITSLGAVRVGGLVIDNQDFMDSHQLSINSLVKPINKSVIDYRDQVGT